MHPKSDQQVNNSRLAQIRAVMYVGNDVRPATYSPECLVNTTSRLHSADRFAGFLFGRYMVSVCLILVLSNHLRVCSYVIVRYFLGILAQVTLNYNHSILGTHFATFITIFPSCAFTHCNRHPACCFKPRLAYQFSRKRASNPLHLPLLASPQTATRPIQMMHMHYFSWKELGGWSKRQSWVWHVVKWL